ncbi:glycosyltransferase family 2 protein [Planctomycetota bacterium]|nr:glycosyltransferase family 2 protein [Planctomycetota bacterium]
MKLLVVIVNYKATGLTLDCLQSISEQIASLPLVKVAVCENGTGDADAKIIAKAIEDNNWASWCWLKAISPNRGFSGGNNAVLKDALNWSDPPENFLLLNADTIVRENAINELLEAANENVSAGIISPRLEWPDGTPQISCFRYINPISEFIDAAHTGVFTKIFKKFDVPIDVVDSPSTPQWTTFACALIRKEVFDQIGLLDPGYFLYFDDPDFCRRAQKNGWAVLNWPKAKVVHLRGKSNPVKSLTKERKRRPSYFYASRARYLAKFYGRVGLWFTNMLWLVGRSLSLIREKIGRKQEHVCDSEVKDIWTNWSHPMRTTGQLGADSK